jgi:nucleoside-diphosphate-sugar epimerase
MVFNRVLVTGGSGFIGTHLINRLTALGREVVNLDIKPPILEGHTKFWVECDIVDRNRLFEVTQRAAADAIIHLGARADVIAKDWSGFASIHEGTKNLIDAVNKSPSVKRIINTSTQYTVGPGNFPESDTDYQPYTTYGKAKAYAESLFFKEGPEATWLTIRPTNIWGPYHPSLASSVWRYLAKRLYLHPDVSPPVVRHYGYVGNAIEQMICLLDAPEGKVHRRVFYISDGELDTAVWLDEFSRQLTGKPTRRFSVPLLKCMARAGDLLRACRLPAPLDSQRLMRMTTTHRVPLQPTLEITGASKIPLEAGVSETVRWLREVHSPVYSGTSTRGVTQ